MSTLCGSAGQCRVLPLRLHYTAQTLEQMRDLTPLTLENPPARANVFVPACNMEGEGFPCDWTVFERALTALIDPVFVVRPHSLETCCIGWAPLSVDTAKADTSIRPHDPSGRTGSNRHLTALRGS